MENIKKNSILVVDDERFNLEILINILNPEYTVYITKSGFSAVEMTNKLLPDLILLDIIMPDMNGFEVLKKLKATDITRHIPVILITGLSNAEDEEKGLELGAADYIYKPFNAGIVKSRVRNQIQIVNQIHEVIKLQKDFKAATKTVETANRGKSIFLTKMSHEMRTPINAILGIAGIQLENETLPLNIREEFSRILSSGDLLLSIINNILDMSNIELEKVEFLPAQYDVANMIYDTIFFNIIKYENKPIDVIVDVDENVPSVLFGDEHGIKQILNNLLSNAFRYTKAGKIKLSVNAKPASGESQENTDDNVMLVFSVCDTGQGMTTEQVGKLFDEYSRFNMESTHKTGGMGLGMNISQNLIHMMGGKLLVESEPDQGSLFTVILPQGNVGAKVLGKEAVKKLSQFRTNYQMKMRITPIKREQISFGRVMVVDDIEMNLYVAGEMLLPYGLKVDKVSSGEEAIEKVRSNTYDLVFMDYMMPVMDGIETTMEIRKLGKEYENLPIIALTANTISGAKEMFLANGFSDFLAKPINMHELNEIIKKWILPEKTAQRSRSKTSSGSQTLETPDANTSTNDEVYDRFLENVAKIGEINIEIGLTYFSDMKDMYCDTLDMFHKKLKPECNILAGFLEAKDIKNFYISIHGIKSSLKAIGESELSKTALDLEMASKNNDIDYCMKFFPEFKEKFLLLCNHLSDIFSGSDMFSKNEI